MKKQQATRRTEAQRRADRRYKLKRVQVSIDFREGDEELALLDRLAKEYGSRKAAIIAGLRAVDNRRKKP